MALFIKVLSYGRTTHLYHTHLLSLNKMILARLIHHLLVNLRDYENII